MTGLKRILVPVDFDETSQAALQYAIALAHAFKVRLYLLHIGESPGEMPEIAQSKDLPPTVDPISRLMRESERHQLRPEYAVRVGVPSDEIVAYAKARDIDLIVMGTHGRDGIARVLGGSVAEKVVRRAPCPVLTVHHPEHALVLNDQPVRASAWAQATTSAEGGTF